jgi:hypothetical protein
VTLPRRRYPTDLTDAEWQLLAPLIPASKPAAAHLSTTAASWSTPWPTGCEPAAPGGCCPTTCHPGKPSTTTSAAGGNRSCGSRSTVCCMSRSGPGKGGGPLRAQRSWTARVSRRPSGGAARLRRCQEGQRPQAPPAGRHPRPGLQGRGDRRRRRRSRRRHGLVAAAGPPAVPPGCGMAGLMAATAARSWTGCGSEGASRSRSCSAATVDGSGAGSRPVPRRRSCRRSPWRRAGGWWSGPLPGLAATGGSARITNTSPPPPRRSSTWP